MRGEGGRVEVASSHCESTCACEPRESVRDISILGNVIVVSYTASSRSPIDDIMDKFNLPDLRGALADRVNLSRLVVAGLPTPILRCLSTTFKSGQRCNFRIVPTIPRITFSHLKQSMPFPHPGHGPPDAVTLFSSI